MQFIGTKFQTYEDGESKIRRIFRIRDGEHYVLKEDGSDVNKIISGSNLLDKYVRIDPDAFLNIMITKEPDPTSNIDVEDVYFCVNRMSDIANGIKEPALILRQNYYSTRKNMLGDMSSIYIGDCLTVTTASKDDIKEMMSFTKIVKQESIAIYLTDSVDDILKLIPNKLRKDINATLAMIKSYLPSMVKGVSNTVEELLADNEFMYNLMSIFNICDIQFPIILGKESYDTDGNIILNNKQMNKLQHVLMRYIDNVKIIKYDKDIDISKIVSLQHVVVKDSNNEIFLIAYETLGYISDGNDDIIKSMMPLR